VYPAKQHYIPREVWSGLLGRLLDELNAPSNGAPFRGSLIDEKMFSIDVKEWGMANLLKELRERRQPKISQEAQPAPLVQTQDL
jgi:hypothetical protein